MTNVLFINEIDLKSDGIISNNVDVKNLNPFIEVAQELYIESMLGEALTTELKDMIISGVTAITPDYLVLLDYIRKPLIWYTTFEAGLHLRIQVTNKGLNKLISTNTVEATDKDIVAWQTSCQNKAEFYLRRLRTYLEVNYIAKYPSWKTCSDTDRLSDRNIEDIYYSGIQFDESFDWKKRRDII